MIDVERTKRRRLMVGVLKKIRLKEVTRNYTIEEIYRIYRTAAIKLNRN